MTAGLLALVTTYAVAVRSRLGADRPARHAARSPGSVLHPTRIDRQDSFVDAPNARSACTGWTFRHYPVGWMDASSTTYCVGLEHRIADG